MKTKQLPVGDGENRHMYLESVDQRIFDNVTGFPEVQRRNRIVVVSEI